VERRKQHSLFIVEQNSVKGFQLFERIVEQVLEAQFELGL